MARVVKCALLQLHAGSAKNTHPMALKKKLVARHVEYIKRAARLRVNILCFQELFYSPYFPAEQDARWLDIAEAVPDGPVIGQMSRLARRHRMALVVPVIEKAMSGLYYNTAAVLDADGAFLGKYRKVHLPHCYPGFWEKFYFRPGDLGYPVFKTRHGVIGVYICYDRHFPEGARALGLAGAEIVFNPSATVAGLSEHLWFLEMPASAVANGYFVGAVNRVGFEEPWRTGEFYGQSFFCNPEGKIVARASRDRDELLVADLDFDDIEKARRTWQFYRDRRPETYGALTGFNNVTSSGFL